VQRRQEVAKKQPIWKSRFAGVVFSGLREYNKHAKNLPRNNPCGKEVQIFRGRFTELREYTKHAKNLPRNNPCGKSRFPEVVFLDFGNTSNMPRICQETTNLEVQIFRGVFSELREYTNHAICFKTEASVMLYQKCCTRNAVSEMVPGGRARAGSFSWASGIHQTCKELAKKQPI